MHPDHSEPDPSIKSGDILNHLRAMFDALVDVPAFARESWLAANVADGDERDALRKLLAADEQSGFLEVPAIGLEARITTAIDVGIWRSLRTPVQPAALATADAVFT